jgi:probable rRNA maturation factor
MLEVDVLGATLASDRISPRQVRALCEATAGRLGIFDAHMAVEFVDERRIAELNRRHRARRGPTDVLSFPIDGRAQAGTSPVELGDVVICAAHAADLREAVVHGVLHLLGMDHETDDGEMLALQDELLAGQRP